MSQQIDLEIPLGKRTHLYRFFEILPGLLSFMFLLLPIVLALIDPLISAIFIIIYIITYIIRAIAVAARTLQGYRVMKEAQNIDWRQRLLDLQNPHEALKKIGYTSRLRWHEQEHIHNLQRLSKKNDHPRPVAIINVVIIATYNELYETLESTIKTVIDGSFPARQIILVVAYEGRGPESTQHAAQALVKKYRKDFLMATAIKHPQGLEGEVIGKGGNIAYAAKKLSKKLVKEGIEQDNVIITTLDADNKPHRSYLSYLSYEFIAAEKRHNRAYQPLALYLTNIWDVPAPMRVLATGNSFWTIINALRPHALRNFAAHSQSLRSLQQTNFWSTRSIVEDGHQYWRSYFSFKGDYEVVPLYVPIYQDAVLSDTYLKTFKAQFLQLRRWAYGASDIPYVASLLFTKNRQVPFWPAFARLIRLIDGHVSWASGAIILALAAWAPLIFATDASRSLTAHALPSFASRLQTVALLGMFISVFLAMKMLPPRPARYKRRRTVMMVLQWALMPVTPIVYGSSAAIYAQFRLLTGRYLDKFDVTDKALVTESGDKIR
ncbi:MAG TPA: glycosyltransferase family 2 protein [Candidatus Saccharimonadales bacterium]